VVVALRHWKRMKKTTTLTRKEEANFGFHDETEEKICCQGSIELELATKGTLETSP
jgi:hypothetical protein